MAAARIGSLDYVMLRARDVAALVDAYREVLDAAPIEEAYPHWARIRLGNIDTGIHLDEAGPGERGAEPAFRVHDVVAFHRGLAGTAFSVEQVEEIPGGVRLGFRDPAGNLLSAIQWGARLDDVEASLGRPVEG